MKLLITALALALLCGSTIAIQSQCPPVSYRQCALEYKRHCYDSHDCKTQQACCDTPCGKKCVDLPCSIVNCLVNPCDGSTCNVGDTVCRQKCGECTAEWVSKSDPRIVYTDKQCQEPLCDMYCPTTSCNGYKCPVDNYQCVPDSCNGCEPMFYDENGKRIECEPVCPDDLEIHYCTKNPCSMSSCPNFPLATCKADYCGGCNAVWEYEGKVITDQMCEAPRCRMMCPDDACNGYACPVDKYVCVPDTCNVCKPRFYDENGKKIECEKICPNGEDIVNCFADPCSVSTCPGVPGATCESNYCGGCNAVWSYNDMLPSEGQCLASAPLCPGLLVMPLCIQFVEHQCGADVRHQCPEGEYCCNNGCMNVCRKPDDRCPANNYQNMNYDALLSLCQKPCSSGCANDEMCCDSGGCGLVCLPACQTCTDPCASSTCGIPGSVCEPIISCYECKAHWTFYGVTLTDEECNIEVDSLCPNAPIYISNCGDYESCGSYGCGVPNQCCQSNCGPVCYPGNLRG